MKKEKEKNMKRKQPFVAPGNAEELLDKEASSEEKDKGEYTTVTRLSWDEVED
ncbi:MAG: hypothetical protein JG764_352 [Clostridiales bacterium]|jgi:hypothetical protein|nr:hypothetical protein [Clostridiales bacterium]